MPLKTPPGFNKLAKVVDAATTVTTGLGDFKDGANTDDDYAYDVNGNLTKDQNKKITGITYNFLNLPEQIKVLGKGIITYQYDAAGNKLSKTTTDSTVTPVTTKTTQYLGGMIFENDALQFVSTEEGRARLNGSTWVFDYMLKDHLGNVRAMITEGGTLLEESAYYPFGLKMVGISLTNANPSLQNKYKTFQGQKFDDDLGLNYFSYKYRNHDPQVGRFIQIDPLSDKYVYNSTYAFSENAVTGDIELEGLEKIKFSDVWNNKANLVDYIASGDALSEIADASYEVNPLRYGIEAITGRTIMSNFTERTDRAGAVIEFGTSVLAPEFKVEGAVIKGSLKVEAAVVKTESALLTNELKVDTYKNLSKAGSVGDNLTPHHIPSAAHMETKGISKAEGVSINMQSSKAGRHQQTFTFGTTADKAMTSRNALAAGVKDTRKIYQQAGLYTQKTTQALQQVVEQNKKAFPSLFNKWEPK